MSKKNILKESFKISISQIDTLKHTRSAFANMNFGGCGAHKSKKDYNRQKAKLATKKAFLEY